MCRTRTHHLHASTHKIHTIHVSNARLPDIFVRDIMCVFLYILYCAFRFSVFLGKSGMFLELSKSDVVFCYVNCHINSLASDQIMQLSVHATCSSRNTSCL